MAENSSISWTKHTLNGWEGCQKVGPGCDHCYAETRNARFGRGVAINWGPNAPRRRTSPANWAKTRKWNAAAKAAGQRHRVFVSSLSDWADNAVDPQWRADLFALIRECEHLDFLMLTKRIGNVESMVEAAGGWPPNAWLMITVVNQEEADRDIPKALAVKAKLGIRVLGLSMEPLLARVDIRVYISHKYRMGLRKNTPCVDWVIVGGESGRKARPMNPDWAMDLLEQCVAAGVAFHFKQWGEWKHRSLVDLTNPKLEKTQTFFPEHGLIYARPGKKAAGRDLAGREWNEVPA